ncbi:hypothetical protein A4X06_0g2903 [Tilletia controversa]|uniref:Uncharacterized protein n=2 Tax=Tilletia TaxID=13289 RepID=A0A8X7MVK5_9BASI|nr:hypothetical protein A4X06_0g2903 [Tilletia controversa]
MSPIHVFDRTEDDFTCYTVEVAAAAATGSSWAPVAACMDTILFPHPVSDKEHWDDDVALAMAGLGLEQAFRTGARIFVLTAGTNRERALLTKRDETATSIDTSGLLKVRSMLISINGHACLFFFVVIRHSAPHFSAATHFDNFDTLADITDVFESMVWALYALWARDQEIRNRPLPPIIASRLWPILKERLSLTTQAYFPAACDRAYCEIYGRQHLLEASDLQDNMTRKSHIGHMTILRVIKS